MNTEHGKGIITKPELIKTISGEYRSLQDIADQFGVTREWVRQVIIKFKLQDYSGRQIPVIDRRKTCSYCNNKVEREAKVIGYGYSYRMAHRECVEKAVWSEPTCHSCNTPFKIRTKELNRQMARRTADWTKGIIFCSKQCYGRYWGRMFGNGAQARTRNYTKRSRGVETVHLNNAKDEIKSLKQFGYGSV